jgi:hypothetical protein
MFCPQCGLEQPRSHRFCPACGSRLPTELVPPPGPKVTRLFHSIPIHPADPPDAVLRVSRYFEEFELETADGSVRIPNGHVRFSMWTGDRAACAVSIPDDEADALVRFLGAALPWRGAVSRV